MTKAVSWLAFVSGCLVLAIAAAAFILSFEAIKALAEQNDVPKEWSWLVPVVVDFAMIAFSVSVLRSALMGEDTRLQWFLIVLFTAVSVSFNVAHSNLQLFGIAIAALAPLALFASFETFMSQIKSMVKRSISVQSIGDLHARINELKHQLSVVLQEVESAKTEHTTIQGQIASEHERLNTERQKTEQDLNTAIQGLRDERDQLRTEIEQLKAERQTTTIDDLDRLILHFLNKNPNASYREIGEFIERSPGTVGGYIKRLTDSGLLHKNGNGYEVAKQ